MKKGLSVMVDAELMKAFSIYCINNNLSKQKIVNDWIKDFMKDKI